MTIVRDQSRLEQIRCGCYKTTAEMGCQQQKRQQINRQFTIFADRERWRSERERDCKLRRELTKAQLFMEGSCGGWYRVNEAFKLLYQLFFYQTLIILYFNCLFYYQMIFTSILLIPKFFYFIIFFYFFFIYSFILYHFFI